MSVVYEVPNKEDAPPTPPVPIKSHENKLMRQNEGRGNRGSEHERAKGVRKGNL